MAVFGTHSGVWHEMNRRTMSSSNAITMIPNFTLRYAAPGGSWVPFSSGMIGTSEVVVAAMWTEVSRSYYAVQRS
jgi:hypothetical protein